MKKYIILFFVLCFNLFGYEYQIYDDYSTIRYFLNTNNGLLQYLYINKSNDTMTYGQSERTFFNLISPIKYSGSSYGYITKDIFDSYYKEDLIFLNDLYNSSYTLQPFLNYLYNDNIFTADNYILYDNYQLLYNSEGLVVESIVNGVYSGLYDNADMGQSGNLYNADKELVLVNGLPPNPIQKWFLPIWEQIYDKFMSAVFINYLEDILIVFFTLALLFFCVKMARRGFVKGKGL